MALDRSTQEAPTNNQTLPLQRGLAVLRLLDMLGLVTALGVLEVILFSGLDAWGKILAAALDGLITLGGGAISATIQAGLSFREAQLKKWRTHPTLRFAIDAFLAVSISAVGLLLQPSAGLSTILGYAIPGLLGAALVTKTLYNFGAGIYYIYKSVLARDEEQRRKSISKSAQHFLTAASYACITAGLAGIFVFSLGAPSLALGVAGIALGVGAAACRVYEVFRHRNSLQANPSSENAATTEGPKQGTSLGLLKSMNVDPTQAARQQVSDAPPPSTQVQNIVTGAAASSAPTASVEYVSCTP